MDKRTTEHGGGHPALCLPWGRVPCRLYPSSPDPRPGPALDTPEQPFSDRLGGPCWLLLSSDKNMAGGFDRRRLQGAACSRQPQLLFLGCTLAICRDSSVPRFSVSHGLRSLCEGPRWLPPSLASGWAIPVLSVMGRGCSRPTCGQQSGQSVPLPAATSSPQAGPQPTGDATPAKAPSASHGGRPSV